MTPWGPLGKDIFNRTYARRKEDRTETWTEMVSRVVEGNLNFVDPQHTEPLEASNLAEHINSMKILPAGRHLWVTGVPGRQFVMNCHRAGWGKDLADHFTFTCDQLMQGGGVGCNVSNDYLDALPAPAGRVELSVVCSPSHLDHESFAHRLVSSPPGGAVLRVLDSREGWVEALGRVYDMAQHGGGNLTVDVSDVRPYGSPIRGFGGTASGPLGLIELLVATADILNGSVGKQLDSLTVMALLHEIAKCVVAGNIRRSARLVSKRWSDTADILDFISAKQSDPEAHWSANISVEVDDFFFEQLNKKAPLAESVWQSVIYNMAANGEPGFYNSALAQQGEQRDVRGCNPCGEITLEDWESCNLGHINLAAFGDDLEGACEAARLMTRFLIRATECDITDKRQLEVTRRNRRIGVGLFGVQEWAAAHSVKWSEIADSDKLRHFIQDMAQVVEEECESYSHELRIPRPIKTRCIAPTGTISKLAGVSEGIHPIYARHYIQRIRYAHNDPNLDKHRELSRHIEDCIYSTGTSVVSIPTRNAILDHYEADLIESVDEIALDTQFEVQAWFQKHWADNAVSFTANIDPDTEPVELSRALRKWLPHLKGTTVFPDLSRPQSPYERIPDGVYEIIEGVMGGNEETGQAFDDCASGACPVR